LNAIKTFVTPLHFNTFIFFPHPRFVRQPLSFIYLSADPEDTKGVDSCTMLTNYKSLYIKCVIKLFSLHDVLHKKIKNILTIFLRRPVSVRSNELASDHADLPRLRFFIPTTTPRPPPPPPPLPPPVVATATDCPTCLTLSATVT
jgi:hypothetical protein